MTKPERYQLPFDFGRKPDHSLVSYEIGLAGVESQTEVGARTAEELIKLLDEQAAQLPDDEGN
jgi:hypothetical protein